jgi:hypothetical protein
MVTAAVPLPSGPVAGVHSTRTPDPLTIHPKGSYMSTIPSIPPEVRAAALKLLSAYGVPIPQQALRLYHQKQLLAELMAAYNQLKKEKTR